MYGRSLVWSVLLKVNTTGHNISLLWQERWLSFRKQQRASNPISRREHHLHIEKPDPSSFWRDRAQSFRNDSFACDKSAINLVDISKWEGICHFERKSSSFKIDRHWKNIPTNRDKALRWNAHYQMTATPGVAICWQKSPNGCYTELSYIKLLCFPQLVFVDVSGGIFLCG